MLTILILTALATWQIVEIWHHSYLFASWRARVDLWDGWFGQMLRCPFCLSNWVAAVVASIAGTAYGLHENAGISSFILLTLVVALAAARLANLGNDLGRRYCRTPKADKFEDLPAGDDDTYAKNQE